MRQQTENVLQKLFSENSLDNIPLERLQQITEAYPYFTLGHYLLTRKLQLINAGEYERQSAKTSIYFNEPMWLQSLLHPLPDSLATMPERATSTEEPVTIAEELPVSDTHPVEPVAESMEPEPAVDIPSQPTQFEETEMSAINKERDETEQVVENATIFEPYHTIDYFASQGIRVSNEIKADDRLGHQLRSFTEWLKTMKRLPETKVEEQLDEVAQQNIQEFASHSLEEEEVVTETMAEVLVKQHKQAEAIAIYEKLSLLNPSKSAYFAAKIEQLKGE